MKKLRTRGEMRQRERHLMTVHGKRAAEASTPLLHIYQVSLMTNAVKRCIQWEK